MTLIDKAEALAILAPAPNAKDGLWAKRKQALHDAIAALPARGVGVPTVDELANIIRMVDGQNSLGAGALAEGILAALAPTDAAHVNETPKSEHDGADVLTAAQTREAALREAARICWEDNAFDLQQRILALIGEART